METKQDPELEQLRKATLRHGYAWALLCIALGIHVVDEALTDFLSVYNPLAERIRTDLPFLPLPIFAFEDWLAGLIVAIVALLLLSTSAFRGARWMVPFSYFFGTFMFLNGLGHIAGSIYLGRLMPGAYSAPLLLAASIYLVVRARFRGHLSTRAAAFESKEFT